LVADTSKYFSTPQVGGISRKGTIVMAEPVRKARRALNSRQLQLFCLVAVIAVVILLPLFWLLISSFKSAGEYTAYPIQFFPSRLRWSNYFGILFYPPFTFALLRTFGLGITTAVITCITSAMAGYAFARLGGRSNRKLFMVVIVLLILPNIVMLLPQFVLYAKLKLINTYWPWYLAALGATNPLYIFMYRQFFLGFPKELEEAAEMDGATPFGIFFRVFLPNAKPAMATIFIFAFNAVWGDYIMPTMFLNDPSKLLGTLLAYGFSPHYQTIFLAATVIYILPVFILFLLVQKNIQKSMIFSGLRG
jgi:ABC-type glycerol-3-phosphate transport system permease component